MLLPSLPHDILIELFSSLHSYTDAIALARCNRVLHDAYTSRAKAICLEILRRHPRLNGEVWNFSHEAMKLYKLQGYSPAHNAATVIASVLRSAVIVQCAAQAMFVILRGQPLDREAYERVALDVLQRELYKLWIVVLEDGGREELRYRGAMLNTVASSPSELGDVQVLLAMCLTSVRPRGFPDLADIIPGNLVGLEPIVLMLGRNVGVYCSKLWAGERLRRSMVQCVRAKRMVVWMWAQRNARDLEAKRKKKGEGEREGGVRGKRQKNARGRLGSG